MIQTGMYTFRSECVWLVEGGWTNKLKLQLTIIEFQSIIIICRAILYLTV